MGRVFPLALSRNLIGRSLEAPVSIDDLKVSRIHAAVDHVHGQFFLVDLGSTNGTYLNGRRVETRTPLKPGDEVRLGSALMRFQPLEVATSLADPQWRENTRVHRLASVEPEEDRFEFPLLSALTQWVRSNRHAITVGLLIALTLVALWI
jgi:pSer/pThr/pTyr-binding forkhead associated (FHA) protein